MSPPAPLDLLAKGRLLLVAGPCVVEGREVTLRIAKRLKEIAASRPVTLLFKASYDKANRTSGESFRGPGIDEALAILGEVRKLGLPVNTDVHESAQVERVAAEARRAEAGGGLFDLGFEVHEDRLDGAHHER